MAMWLIGKWIYLAGSSSRKDGLDHDSCAPPPYDAKAKPLPIIGQLNHLHMTPLMWQRLEEKGGRENGGGERKSILIKLLTKKWNNINRVKC